MVSSKQGAQGWHNLLNRPIAIFGEKTQQDSLQGQVKVGREPGKNGRC